MLKSLNIVFAGTPEIAASILAKILEHDFTVSLVLTKADSKANRGNKLQPSAVKQLALAKHIPVSTPISLKIAPEVVDTLQQIKPDIMVVVAYGLIIPPEILEIPRYGCVNIHMSLLPQHRGAAPIARAILANDATSGVTIMQMDSGLDSGEIIVQQVVHLAHKETSGSLTDKLTLVSQEMIIEYLANLADGKLAVHTSQAEQGVTHAAKISKTEASINWQEDAVLIERKIRGFNPSPGCFTYLNGVLVKIWQASVDIANLPADTNSLPGTIVAATHATGLKVCCGNNSCLALEIVQLSGKNRQTAQELLCGHHDLLGSRFIQQ